MKKDELGIFGQWISGCVVGIGIYIEIITRAEIGVILITAGSLVYAVATKLRGK